MTGHSMTGYKSVVRNCKNLPETARTPQAYFTHEAHFTTPERIYFVGRAEWRVTSVLQSKTLAQGEFTSPEHVK